MKKKRKNKDRKGKFRQPTLLLVVEKKNGKKGRKETHAFLFSKEGVKKNKKRKNLSEEAAIGVTHSKFLSTAGNRAQNVKGKGRIFVGKLERVWWGRRGITWGGWKGVIIHDGAQ